MKRAAFGIARPLVRDSLARVWWVVLLGAVVSILFGTFAFVWPRIAAFGLIALFGAYALVDGLTALILSVQGGGLRQRWWMALAALTSMLAGLFAFAEPRLMALLLISIVGGWLIVRGLSHLLGTFVARDELRGNWSLAVDGLMSALFGAGLMFAPQVGALGLVWALGGWAFIHGILMVPLSLRLRRRIVEEQEGLAGAG